MIKEFVEWLTDRINVEEMKIGGQTFTTQKVHLVPDPTPETLVVRNLSGLVEYLINDFDGLYPLMVHVVSPTLVTVHSKFNSNLLRMKLIEANALLPTIPFERFMDAEQFNILLQSCFVKNSGRDAVLKVVGNIKEETVQSIGDDGVSQQVTAKSGISTVENVKVPNPVALKPFRTFVEVEQPESEFVFRMKNGPLAALFEADGGAWKLTAIQRIKDYLETSLKTQIENGRVSIIA